MAIDAALDSISAFFSQYPLLKTMSSAIVALAAVFLFILFFEARAGRRLGRFTTRRFVTDLCYALIYQGGIYNTLLYAPIFAGIAMVTPQWHPELIAQLPLPIGFL